MILCSFAGCVSTRLRNKRTKKLWMLLSWDAYILYCSSLEQNNLNQTLLEIALLYQIYNLVSFYLNFNRWQWRKSTFEITKLLVSLKRIGQSVGQPFWLYLQKISLPFLFLWGRLDYVASVYMNTDYWKGASTPRHSSLIIA